MNPNPYLPLIGITMGDPLGIGPEIIVKTLQQPDLYTICRPLVIGDARVLGQAAKLIGSPVKILTVKDSASHASHHEQINLLPVSDLPVDCASLSGPTRETGAAMQAYIIKGIDLAMEKKIDALVTAPITKTAMKLAGSDFHGHTELLAHRTKTDRFAMMMAGDSLKVVLVTIHISLAQVPEQLTVEKIFQTIALTHEDLKNRFGIGQPKIGVAGLNPHAGEDRLFGSEEETLIIPAIDKARAALMDATGPYPPDTIFFKARQGAFDAVVCMYHDQGLIPFKLVHFSDGVNTTLGLPIIRTSVDHGTAYDIAWQGKADPTSLNAAIRMAALQAGHTYDHENSDSAGRG